MSVEITATCGGWHLVVEDIGDDDMRHRFTHTAFNSETEERINLLFTSLAEMNPSMFELYCDLGLNSTNMTYPGAPWNNKDLELAWYRKHYPRGTAAKKDNSE